MGFGPAHGREYRGDTVSKPQIHLLLLIESISLMLRGKNHQPILIWTILSILHYFCFLFSFQE